MIADLGFDVQAVANKTHLASLPPSVTEWKQPVEISAMQMEAKALSAQRLWKPTEAAERLIAKHDSAMPLSEKVYIPSEAALDYLFKSSRMRKRSYCYEPKPPPENPGPKHKMTKCNCMRDTMRDQNGVSLYWDSDGAMCQDCDTYYHDLNRKRTKETEGDCHEGDNAGKAKMRVVQEEHALPPRPQSQHKYYEA